MSKSILIIDKPNICGECALRMAMICTPTLKDIDSVNTRMDWCPLKEMPKRMKYHDGIYNGQVKGWNLCLEAILKEDVKVENI